jgi:thioesterase domain-containing protein
VAEFAALPLLAKPSYAGRTLVSLWRRLLWRVGATDQDQPPAFDMRVPEALQRVYDASLAAVAHYRPGRYHGPTALYVCEERDPLMAPPGRVWRNHAHALETFSTPGNHRSMLAGENATRLARMLSQRLAEALCGLQRNGE